MAAAAFLVCVRAAEPEARRALWRDGLIALVGVTVLFAPWLPTLVYQARHTGAPWDLPPVLWSLSQGLYSLVGGRGGATALLLAGGSGLWALRQPGTTEERLRLAVKALAILGFGTLVVAWAYSKVTPAWAIRYLAVIVGPLMLLFGLGLSRAGRLGLVALALLACWWVLDPVPKSRDSKSNVEAVAAQLRHHLGSDPLVLSAQPEQVPTIAYYLPAVKHFGTPIGPVADPGVVDWRSALAKLERSSVHGVLMPMIDRLRPGPADRAGDPDLDSEEPALPEADRPGRLQVVKGALRRPPAQAARDDQPRVVERGRGRPRLALRQALAQYGVVAASASERWRSNGSAWL